MLDAQPLALNPDTPLAWVMARLKASETLAALLGATPDDPRIYQPGEVPLDEAGNAPPLHVMVVPPETVQTRSCMEKYPQSQTARFLIFVEGQGEFRLDEVLAPIHLEMQQILAGVDDPASPTGGAVYSAQITGFHTPRAFTLTSQVALKHKGFFLTIQAV